MGAENYTPENHVQEGPKTVENKDTQVVEQLNKTGEELNNLIENIDKTNPIVSQNLETAMDNLSQETKDIIKEMMNIPEGQQVTAASIKVSAGADSIRWKNFINAQKKYTKSIEQLKAYEQKLGKNNIAQIITEIDSKIGDISKKQSNQTGNRYIIGSRIAQ